MHPQKHDTLCKGRQNRRMHNITSQGKTMLEGEGNTKGNKITLPHQQEVRRKQQ